MELLIRYKDAEGRLSERRISKIEPQGSDHFFAFCHKRQEYRTFKLSRIESVVEAQTGEVIENLYTYLGIEQPKLPLPANPVPEPIPVSFDEVRRRRTKEKRELFRPFVLPVIAERAKQRFFAFFGGQCFKCGSAGPLVIDHHIPIVLGGHLTPGNLVALCKRCNDRKADSLPEVFYTKAELKRLQVFLDNQIDLFAFVFDWKAWRSNRESYLHSLGIDANLVHEVLNNPDHRFYIPPDNGVGITITVGGGLAKPQSEIP